MPEYIDLDTPLELYVDRGGFYRQQITTLRELLDTNKIPYTAADVRPVVKATWKRIDYKPCGHDYECSSCGWKNDMATHFCPNCGADMREENNG